MKCWLCEQEDFAPGESSQNIFGDIECIYCTSKIEFMVFTMTHPDVIPVIKGINNLPKVDGVSVGFKYEEDD